MMTAANILLGNDDSRKNLTWRLLQSQLSYLAMITVTTILLAMMTAANILLGNDDSRKYLTWQ
jgi:hypothetical protein